MHVTLTCHLLLAQIYIVLGAIPVIAFLTMPWTKANANVSKDTQGLSCSQGKNPNAKKNPNSGTWLFLDVHASCIY